MPIDSFPRKAAESRRILYKLRPPRVAILVPADASWDAVENMVAGCYWYWGGHLTLFVPYTPDGAIDPWFLDEIDLYDPDMVYGIEGEADGIRASLERLLGKHACPFPWVKRSIRWHFTGAEHDRDSSVALPVLLTEIPRRAQYVRLTRVPEADEWLRVLAYERWGHLTHEQINRLGHPPTHRSSLDDPRYPSAFVVGTKDLSPHAAILRLVDGREEPSEFGTLPTEACGFELAYMPYNANGDALASFVVDADVPAVIVVGHSFSDFCLYHNLRALRRDVHWLPIAAQEDEGETSAHLSLLRDSLSTSIGNPYSGLGRHRVLLASRSLSAEDLELARQALCSDTSAGQGLCPDTGADGAPTSRASPSLHERISIAQSHSELLPYHVEHVESNNVFYRYMQFLDGQAAVELSTPLPKAFAAKCPPTEYDWVCEIEVGGYTLPRRRDLVDGHLEGVSADRARLSHRGFAFLPKPAFTFSWQDLESIVVRPRLVLQSMHDLVARLFGAASLYPALSDKGRYFSEVLGRFGSLRSLADCLLGCDGQRLLRRYLDTKARPAQGSNTEGCLLNGRRYLNLPAVVAALVPEATDDRSEDTWKRVAGTIDPLLDAGLLKRGIALKCSRCSYADWYPLSDISDHFTCRRCSSSQPWHTQEHYCRMTGLPPEPQWFYQLDEVFFQFLKGGSAVTAVALSAIERASRCCLYVPEVGIWKEQVLEGNPAYELDFVALADGRVIVGECKASLGRLDKVKKQLRGLAEVARTVSADIIVLAIASAPDDARIDQVRQYMESSLCGSGTQVEISTYPDLSPLVQPS
jgi:hypothetical protein